jgi:hypothetical protein
MRWKGKCDCTPHSTWKEPFRNSLDALGREIDTLYVEGMQKYDHDTWETRNQYGSVVCGEESPDEFVQRVFGDMTEPERTRLIVLLTAQVERQRMFTSCGWFFDDLDRIEPRNNIFYAAQAVWLTKFATGKDLAGYGSELLSKVSSWRSGLTGDIVFQHHLQRADDIHSSQGLRIPKVY